MLLTSGSEIRGDSCRQSVEDADNCLGDSSSLVEVLDSDETILNGSRARQSHGQSSPTENLEELHDELFGR
jgi:hypothetical protein